jgi:hypothetical protein
MKFVRNGQAGDQRTSNGGLDGEHDGILRPELHGLVGEAKGRSALELKDDLAQAAAVTDFTAARLEVIERRRDERIGQAIHRDERLTGLAAGGQRFAQDLRG